MGFTLSIKNVPTNVRYWGANLPSNPTIGSGIMELNQSWNFIGVISVELVSILIIDNNYNIISTRTVGALEEGKSSIYDWNNDELLENKGMFPISPWLIGIGILGILILFKNKAMR